MNRGEARKGDNLLPRGAHGRSKCARNPSLPGGVARGAAMKPKTRSKDAHPLVAQVTTDTKAAFNKAALAAFQRADTNSLEVWRFQNQPGA